jgi:hypothetical protein
MALGIPNSPIIATPRGRHQATSVEATLNVMPASTSLFRLELVGVRVRGTKGVQVFKTSPSATGRPGNASVS